MASSPNAPTTLQRERLFTCFLSSKQQSTHIAVKRMKRALRDAVICTSVEKRSLIEPSEVAVKSTFWACRNLDLLRARSHDGEEKAVTGGGPFGAFLEPAMTSKLLVCCRQCNLLSHFISLSCAVFNLLLSKDYAQKCIPFDRYQVCDTFSN